MDILRFGYDLLAQKGGVHIASGEFEGRRVWVKRAAESKKTFWHVLQGVAAKIFNQPMIAPTVIDGTANSFAAEIQKLKDFRGAGVSVPEVLAADDAIMVISDLGECLEHLLNQNKEPAYQKEILMQAVRALSALHQKGMVHGKPYVRDMTLVKVEIGFLDLEENPQDFMSLPQAQARDIWLFLSFAAKYARDRGDKYKYDESLIHALFEVYKLSASGEVLAELDRFVRFLNPIGKILETPFLWRIIGSDARRAVFVNGVL